MSTFLNESFLPAESGFLLKIRSCFFFLKKSFFKKKTTLVCMPSEIFALLTSLSC